MKTKSNNREHTRNSISEPASNMQSSQLIELFQEELQDIYWAEKALTTAIPVMIKNATSSELASALENHLNETKEQVKRLEQVFAMLDKKATAKKCEAMAGLIKESKEIMKDCEKGIMRDAGVITAGQKIEHYEIASYGTLCQFAHTLEMEDAAQLLEETLMEEKAADQKLSDISHQVVHIETASHSRGL
ncbi:MAG TPA: ferritin-like domain-containing protein [Bacteroidia bacterium]|jgi:ferritin-like metal-binding protein YciE|nr:ferritin-like domain-containing protein [Bacteroidia bacterium]